MTTQWSSSDQARQLSCLIANGAVQVQRNLDIQPTVREGLPCQPDNEVRHLTCTDEFDTLEAIRWLRASKATILSADREKGTVSFVWGDRVKAPVMQTTDWMASPILTGPLSTSWTSKSESRHGASEKGLR